MDATKFSAPDIECAGCATAIRKALSRVEGVASIEVDIEQKTVTIAHEVAPSVIISALERAGFPATVKG